MFIAEFVERLPTIFPVNIWGTYLFEIEHRWAKWLISDPLPHGTCWINDPMIRLQIAQISDSINPCPEWTWSITGLKMDLLERNAIDQKSLSGFSQRNASLVRKLFIYFFNFNFLWISPFFFSFFYIFLRVLSKLYHYFVHKNFVFPHWSKPYAGLNLNSDWKDKKCRDDLEAVYTNMNLSLIWHYCIKLSAKLDPKDFWNSFNISLRICLTANCTGTNPTWTHISSKQRIELVGVDGKHRFVKSLQKRRKYGWTSVSEYLSTCPSPNPTAVKW